MAVEALVPIGEYLATSYDPEMEYVDGQLVERNVGEYDHSQLQGSIIMLLGERSRGRFRVLPEQRVQVSPSRYRVPDVCVMALPHRREPVLTQPPHLAIEIRSPEDRLPAILAKVSDYLAFGIQHVWVIDPHKRTVQEYGPDLVRQAEDLTLETELVGRIDFGLLFAALDQPTE